MISDLYTLQESKEFRTKQARKGEMTRSVRFSVSRTSIVCEDSTVPRSAVWWGSIDQMC